MEIQPGERLVVHYTFPSGKKTFTKEDVQKGVTMSIEADCTLRIPPSDVGDITVTYKVHFYA